MTRVLLLLLVLITTSLASAQEFKLEINGNNPTNPGPEMQLVTAVFLGYDPVASDELEWQDRAWIERRTYPVIGQIPIFEQGVLENDRGRDLAFRDPSVFNLADTTWQTVYRADLSKMDIRRKPVADSFAMKWVLFVDPSNETATPSDKMTLSWDKNQIPSIVKHLIMSYKNGRQIIDMKTSNSIVLFGDSLRANGGSQNVGITLYYNQGIPAGVRYAEAGRARLSAYPNPAIAHSKLMLELTSTEYVVIAIYDVQGREVMSRTFQAHQGMNEITVDRRELGLASGTYIVRALIGSGAEQVMQTASLRLQ